MIPSRRASRRASPAWLALALLALPACKSASEAPAPGAAPAAVATPTSGTTTLEALNATLWFQQAAEARGLCLQAYGLARLRLEQALNDPGWTAAEEQTGEFAALPPAVILDVDETVLDNSYFQARLLQAGRTFTPQAWTAWCAEGAATPLDGAREFCQWAQAQGVTVFYLTNRTEEERPGTRRNLEAQGFPFTEGVETLLCKAGKSDKGPRRQAVAERYRVLLLVGDNVTDFSSAFNGKLGNARRVELARQQAEKWGTRWILLPNPVYGTWEAPAAEGGETVAEKLAALRGAPGS